MAGTLEHVKRAMASTLWAILPEKLDEILALLELRASGTRLEPEAIRARIGDEGGRREPRTGAGQIRVIPLFGVLTRRASQFDETSGMTSTDRFRAWFEEALASPDVAAIVLDVDSPGGSVYGIQELAGRILEARGTKPIIAVANNLAASAAYWIAVAADELVVTPSGEVGSIGVFAVHYDWSKAMADAGVQPTLVKAGRFKAEGLPEFPLDPEARDAWQARIDDYYDAFVKGVAKARNVSPAAVRAGFGEGRVVGAKEAVALGMADRVDTLDGVLGRLAGRKSGKARATAAHEGPTMEATDRTEDPADANDPVLAPASVAKELTMSTGTAAPDSGAAPNEALVQERKRMAGLSALAKEHGKDVAWLTERQENGTTVETAKSELLAEFRRGTAAAPPVRPASGDTAPRFHSREDGKPFASFGEQLLAIQKAAINPGAVDPRLLVVNAAASGSNESSGSDGGFAVQKDFLADILTPIYDTGRIVSRCRQVPISVNANGTKIPVIDETSRVTGSRFGGIQMYWAAEADTVTAKRPKLRLLELDLKKLLGFWYLTDEIMQDAAQLEAVGRQAFRTEAEFMIEDAIIRGNGAGQPLGILNSGAKVEAAIEATQTIANSDQFIAKNVANMLSRVPPSLWGNLVFLYNPALLPTLVTARIGTDGHTPVWMAGNSLAGAPQDTILGRPAFASEYCEAVGTPGDLILAAFSEYAVAEKGGIGEDISMHVRFLQDELCYRIRLRMDGQPVWRSAVTPYKGSASFSPFVTLGTRS